MFQEPFLIILATFPKKNRNFSKNVDFVRVSFQFLAQGLRAVRRIPGLTTSLGRSFQGLVDMRAVLAGVPKTHRKNQVKGLNATLAALAALVAFAQRGRVQSILLLAAIQLVFNFLDPKIDVSIVSSESFPEAHNPSF